MMGRSRTIKGGGLLDENVTVVNEGIVTLVTHRSRFASETLRRISGVLSDGIDLTHPCEAHQHRGLGHMPKPWYQVFERRRHIQT